MFFVPGAIPGDAVAVKKSESRQRAQWVTEFAIASASPDRCAPFCVVQACGGCALRVMNLQAAAEHKRQRVIDSLQRIAGIVTEVLPVVADGALAYRHRVRLACRWQASVGYRRAFSHQVLALGACPVLEPALAQAMRDIARIFASGIAWSARSTPWPAKTRSPYKAIPSASPTRRTAPQRSY